MIYFSDVDVVGKLATCGFLPVLPDLLGVAADEVEIRYLPSLRSRISRPGKKLKNPTHQRHLADFCNAHSFAEPGNVNRQEELIQAGLDSGEAILFAEAEETGGIVVTGDKRALAAYAKISTHAQRKRIKVVCWELLLLRVHRIRGYEFLRSGCCEGIECDKLLKLAFSSGLATQETHAIEALNSYLAAVKKHSGDILADMEI